MDVSDMYTNFDVHLTSIGRYSKLSMMPIGIQWTQWIHSDHTMETMDMFKRYNERLSPTEGTDERILIDLT